MSKELIVTIFLGLCALAGGVIGTYVALVVKITKVDTRLEHVEEGLKEEKEANEKYKSETSTKLTGIYKALNEIKLLIAKNK